jgi:hypothetical protein
MDDNICIDQRKSSQSFAAQSAAGRYAGREPI